MPPGASRYAWDHAVTLLGEAVPPPCQLTSSKSTNGAVSPLPSNFGLVDPPPAPAEMRRGRGMTLAGSPRVAEEAVDIGGPSGDPTAASRPSNTFSTPSSLRRIEPSVPSLPLQEPNAGKTPAGVPLPPMRRQSPPLSPPTEPLAPSASSQVLAPPSTPPPPASPLLRAPLPAPVKSPDVPATGPAPKDDPLDWFGAQTETRLPPPQKEIPGILRKAEDSPPPGSAALREKEGNDETHPQ